MSVHALPTATSPLVTKQALAQHLGRSPRWIEMRVNEGMPSENLDRHGRRLFDVRKVEDWLAAGQPVAATLAERVATLEAEVKALRDYIEQQGRNGQR